MGIPVRRYGGPGGKMDRIWAKLGSRVMRRGVLAVAKRRERRGFGRLRVCSAFLDTIARLVLQKINHDLLKIGRRVS